MPRPGPRPYECVRRAWHSDRHHPLRGSLIKEIFRVVNEIHSSATRKNREWQEKLPIVVLKAEEIMYSKANSEAEYMDLKTLWDRANEAINTIIRRDESTETGNLLHPCIEAALILGCTPRRTSRSQRNSDPGCYLSSEYTFQRNHITNTPIFSSNFTKPTTNGSFPLDSEFHSPVNSQDPKYISNKLPSLCENFPLLPNSHSLPIEANAFNSCSTYPLYYGNQLQSQESRLSQFSSCENPDLAKTSQVQDLLPHDLDASNEIPGVDSFEFAHEKPCEIGCDLSLRLGPLLVPCVSFENSWPQEVEDGSSTSRDRGKSSDSMVRMDTDFSFFPRAIRVDDPIDSCSSRWSFEAEITSGDNVKKAKGNF